MRRLLTSIIAVLLAGAAAGRSLEAQEPRAALDRLHGLALGSIVGSSTVYFPTAAVPAELESIAPGACSHLPRVTAPPALPNDNRVHAGTLRDGTLTLRLEARAVAWQPKGRTAAPWGCVHSPRRAAPRAYRDR